MTVAVASERPLRALLVDDERLLREQLKARLADVWPALVILGEARDGQEALEKADALRPDVVFLDIRMPGMTGLEAAAEIVALPSWSGEIVFVTAYDEYAIAAFEQGALDYLLKP
ncbi:MAG TPA: response regulator, partial [Ramlibacter sp.]|nr:response regulator [Ramlibacter sp.]